MVAGTKISGVKKNLFRSVKRFFGRVMIAAVIVHLNRVICSLGANSAIECNGIT